MCSGKLQGSVLGVAAAKYLCWASALHCNLTVVELSCSYLLLLWFPCRHATGNELRHGDWAAAAGFQLRWAVACEEAQVEMSACAVHLEKIHASLLEFFTAPTGP
jgi:hypothetical protein